MNDQVPPLVGLRGCRTALRCEKYHFLFGTLDDNDLSNTEREGRAVCHATQTPRAEVHLLPTRIRVGDFFATAIFTRYQIQQYSCRRAHALRMIPLCVRAHNLLTKPCPSGSFLAHCLSFPRRHACFHTTYTPLGRSLGLPPW